MLAKKYRSLIHRGVIKTVKFLFALLRLEVHSRGFEAEMQRQIAAISPNLIREEIYRTAKGVLHIGAHLGQEAERYHRAGARVIWFEAIESVYQKLLGNIANFVNQKAYLALLGDQKKIVDFHISSNEVSSSIYLFSEGNGFNLEMTSIVELEMNRLDSFIDQEQIRLYPHWVIDVQGAELQVLQGAGDLLKLCQSIDIEISTFEVYEGATKFSELDKFLRAEGFVSLWKPREQTHEDLLYFRVMN